MAEFYNSPHTSWINSNKSYWVPIRYMMTMYNTIRTWVFKANMRGGIKWNPIDEVTSERRHI